MAIFWYIFIAYISIFIHELGHYCSAYLFGIKATDVITGMGFKLFSLQTKWTTFTFNIIPGGGVTIYQPDAELKLSKVKQLIVLAAGVTFNYISAIVATTLYYETSLLKGFIAFHQMIINFIQNLISVFSFQDLIAPPAGITESIQLVASQFTTIKFILFIFIFMNLLLFLFNLLPIPFFDGGQMISLYTDPLLYKLGISPNLLEWIKDFINRLVGAGLILIATLPIVGDLYHRFTQNQNSLQVMIKWVLIGLGILLIKRVSSFIIHHLKLNK